MQTRARLHSHHDLRTQKFANAALRAAVQVPSAMRSGAECDSAGSASPHLAPDDESTSGAPHCLAPAASLTARYRACRLLRDAAHLKRCAAGHRRHALTFGQASHPTGPTVSSTGYKLAVLHWYARPGELQPVHPNPARMARAVGCCRLTPGHTHAPLLTMLSGTAALGIESVGSGAGWSDAIAEGSRLWQRSAATMHAIARSCSSAVP